MIVDSPALGAARAVDRRAAALLVVARPVGALAFTAALLLLPRWVSTSVVDDVTWSFFGYLFLTSILNLGLERLVGPWAGRHPDTPLPRLMAPVLTARLISIPLGSLALWALLAVVRVDLQVSVFAWTVLWIAAGQVGTWVYAVARVEGGTAHEAVASVAVRALQAAALILGGMAEWSPSWLVGSLAMIELAAAVVLLRSMRLRPSGEMAAVRSLPWRELAGFTALELVGFLYLRTDTVLVGRLLDPTAGTTYTLLYRVIDAALAVVTPLVLVLYPQAALRSAAGQSLEKIRRVGLGLVPKAAVVAAAMGVLVAQPVLDLVPRYADHAVVLRCLLAAAPLMTWNAIELHLRAAEGGTKSVLRVGVLTWLVAIVASIPFIDRWGLRGAALGVVTAESVQLILLGSRAARPDQRAAAWVLLAAFVLGSAGWWAEDVSIWWVGPCVVGAISLRRALPFVRELR